MLDDIRRPVEGYMEAYGEFLRRSVHSDKPLVSDILDYVFENRGKGIRPLLVLLSAGMHSACGMGPRTFVAAMLVEMLHTASLIHDDVIDHSDMRRGRPSVNAVWGNRNAILAGDYLIATALDAGLRSAQFDIVTYVMRSLGILCEGELVQGDHARRLEMSRSDYLGIIYEKTASLLAVSSGAGALSVGAPRSAVEDMNRLGEYMGMAFQIKDDILDYDLDADTGKPSCNDLRERKITLPLLHVLENSSPQQRSGLRELLSAGDDESIARLHDAVMAGGGVDAARQVMNSYLSRAASLLASYPESDYRNSLVLMCSFIADRQS